MSTPSEPRPEVLVLIAEPSGRHVPIFVEVRELGAGRWTVTMRGHVAAHAGVQGTREAAISAAMGFRP